MQPQYEESLGARSSPVAYSDRVKGQRENGPSGRSRESLRSLRSGGGDIHGALQIKSNHCTSALVSEILTSVLQTVQKTKQQFTYGQYIFTDCTEDNVQNTHTYTQYTQCTIKTYFVTNTPIHIIHRIYTSALCPHLCIVMCEGATDYNLQ